MEGKAYSLTAEEALAKLHADRQGLTAAEAAARRERVGANELEDSGRKSVAAVFLSQFKDLLVAILAVAALVSAVSGNVESTVVIHVVHRR